MTNTRDILLIGFGNPARADDGLGPALARAIERAAIPGVVAMWDYQPGVEHAADAAEHAAVIFVDASTAGPGPFTLQRLLPREQGSFSTHLLRPEQVLALARDTLGWQGDAYLLAIRGYAFDAFEETLSPAAEANLRATIDELGAHVANDRLEALVTDPPTDRSDRSGAPCQT